MQDFLTGVFMSRTRLQDAHNLMSQQDAPIKMLASILLLLTIGDLVL